MHKLNESLLVNLPPFRRLSQPQIRAILDAATPLRGFAAAADKHALFGLPGGGFHRGGIEPVERHEVGIGDVDFSVLGGGSDIDEGDAFAGLEIGVELGCLNFHGLFDY